MEQEQADAYIKNVRHSSVIYWTRALSCVYWLYCVPSKIFQFDGYSNCNGTHTNKDKKKNEWINGLKSSHAAVCRCLLCFAATWIVESNDSLHCKKLCRSRFTLMPPPLTFIHFISLNYYYYLLWLFFYPTRRRRRRTTRSWFIIYECS